MVTLLMNPFNNPIKYTFNFQIRKKVEALKVFELKIERLNFNNPKVQGLGTKLDHFKTNIFSRVLFSLN